MNKIIFLCGAITGVTACQFLHLTNKQIEWVASHLDVIYLDSRTFKEYSISYLSNAHWVGEKGEHASQFISNKIDLVLVYCTTGHRSGLVTRTWREKGYSNVVNLKGGIFEWVRNDLDIYSNNQKTFYLHTHSYLRSWLLPPEYTGVWE